MKELNEKKVNSWHIRDIVIRHPQVKRVTHRIFRGHPRFCKERIVDDDGWVFQPPFDWMRDRRAELEAYRDAGHDDSEVAGVLFEVIDSVTE